MALTTVEASKKSVSKAMRGQWVVTWTLKGFDETVAEITEFERDFNEDYKKGDSISRVEAGFISQMQGHIDDYKQEQTYLNAPAHDTAVANVQAALEV